MDKDTVTLFSVGLASATSGLSGCKLAQHGLETGSVALTSAGCVFALGGAFATVACAALTFANYGGPVSPSAGASMGALMTLGAFELADSPIITFDDFKSEKKNEQMLTETEVSKIINPKALNFKFS